MSQGYAANETFTQENLLENLWHWSHDPLLQFPCPRSVQQKLHSRNVWPTTLASLSPSPQERAIVAPEGFQHSTPPMTHTYTNVERLNARRVEPKGQRIPSFTQPHAHSRGIASQEYWGLGLPHLPHSKGIGSIAEDTS